MGFRFRRSIRILPGIRLNFGKRSISTSLGIRGAHVTLRPGHTARTTVGIPGTGLSYTEGGQVEKPHQTALTGTGEAQSAADPEALPKGRAWRGWLWVALAMVIAGLYIWGARNH